MCVVYKIAASILHEAYEDDEYEKLIALAKGDINVDN